MLFTTFWLALKLAFLDFVIRGPTPAFNDIFRDAGVKGVADYTLDIFDS